MTDKSERKSPDGGPPEDGSEKRKEKRYEVPEACQQDIKLRVKHGNEFVPAILANFSRSGILFECPVAFSKGIRTECLLSISLRLPREISFSVEVRYCYSDSGSHITGASIVSISDEIWFDVFVEAHDLIVLGKGA
jgi:hypothetical protein